VNACALRLRSSARARYLPFIEQEFPHLVKRYRATYAFDHKVSRAYSERLSKQMRELCAKYGISTGHYGRAPDSAPELVEQRFAGSEQLELEMSAP
jgi:hypothetical protein